MTGVLNNCLVILIIKNSNKKKLFKEPMYKHIIINALFNIAYCSIMSLSLINTCIFLNTNAFCSNVYHRDTAQYFKIIVGAFLGNVFKTCSHISFLFFLFHRFVLVSNLKSEKVFAKFLNLNTLVYVLVMLLFSIAISLFRLFQYGINFQMRPELEFPYEIVNEYKCDESNNENDTLRFKCHLFDAFKIINKFFNDILFFVLNLVIDSLLLKFFNRDMQRKLRMRSPTLDSADLLKKKKKVNRMVFTNGFIIFVTHMPEFVVTLMLLVFRNRIANFCTYKLPCDLIDEEAQSLSLVSTVAQCFVFVKFDKNFRESFLDLYAKLIFKLSNLKIMKR